MSAAGGTRGIAAGDPLLEEERRRGLRRMRSLAVGLLVLAALVYLLTLGQDGPGGFVNAAAEAAMVGAIADWFAVTALFRHPLGLPIPHTALVPRRKEMLGRSLEEFFAENFLVEDVLRERAAAVEISLRVGEWLDAQSNAQRVVEEAASLVTIAVERLDDEDLEALVAEALLPRLLTEPVSPLAGSLLQEVVHDGAHHGLVDLVLAEAHRWLVGNEDTFAEVVAERAPWWAPTALNERVTHRLHVELVAWIADIRDDPEHHARLALDDLLAQLADDLLRDPATQERMESLKDRVLGHPQVLSTAVALWRAFRSALVGALGDRDGMLRARALGEVSAFGTRLREDAALRERLDGHAADLVVFAVSRYGNELTAVITQTIDRWDGREAARKIELHVGRDLQFIRINGTVVGGLVGLVIHTVAVVVESGP